MAPTSTARWRFLEVEPRAAARTFDFVLIRARKDGTCLHSAMVNWYYLNLAKAVGLSLQLK